MVFEFSNYRSFLRSVLTSRAEKNPAYTMRAFALQVGIAPSMLTSIFQFRRNLSQLKAYQVGRKLGLNEAEVEYFSLLVQLESAKAPELRAALLARINTLNPQQKAYCLTADRFQLIAQWYHSPIIAMAGLHDFTLTAKTAASRLKISESEAELALERLERLELLKREPEGSYVKVHESVLVSSDIPDAGLRKFYTQMLNKGIESLDTQSTTERYTSSLTIAFDPGQLSEARRIMNDCLAKVEELAAKGKKRDKVYHLDAIFFDLTQEKHGEHIV